MTRRTVPDILREQARVMGSQRAIVESPCGREKVVTFAELNVMASAFAAYLERRGIRPGDRVLVFVPMSIALYVTLLGIFRRGAVAVFIDPSAGLRNLDACCRAAMPAAWVGIGKAHLLRLLVPAMWRIPMTLRMPAVSEGPTEVDAFPAKLPRPEDAALMTFTSGSTGRPKAALRTHAFLLAQHAALVEAIALEQGEVDLTTLPIFVLANLASGVTSILPDADMSRPGSVDAARIAAQIRRYRPTRTGGSPAFYERLLATESSDGELRGFRKIYTGGGPVFPRLLERLHEAAPEANVTAVYGSTEAEPIGHIAWPEITAEDHARMREGAGLLTGIPVPQIQCRVVRDQWGKTIGPFTAETFSSEVLGPGNVGEIVVAGDHVLPGYVGGEGDEETKFRVGEKVWHRTGDAGQFDKKGRLWLLGRCAARIEDAAGVTYPFAVECLAQSFAFVRRSAFVRHAGRRLLLVEVETKPDDEMWGELNEAVAKFRVDEVRRMKLPVDRRHNAKVDYGKLSEALEKRTSRS